jgi:guanosine-3',5'-bis(diphosphate) 3'-pyrophosphohydrolase
VKFYKEKQMDDIATIMKAADAAACWHVSQRRKAAPQAPYVNHLLEVAYLVSRASPDSDPSIVIAALLHDAVEDQEVPIASIERDFGQEVAGLVMEVTDDKTKSPEERKRKQIETVPIKSRKAKMIKLADMVSNLRALPDCNAKRKLDYVSWAKDVAVGCKGVSKWLEQLFDETAECAEQLVLSKIGLSHRDSLISDDSLKK